MESFSIKWKSSAKKELKKILGTEHIYRIRVGNYRVIYSVVNDELVIEVIRVRHRKEVYKNFP